LKLVVIQIPRESAQILGEGKHVDLLQRVATIVEPLISEPIVRSDPQDAVLFRARRTCCAPEIETSMSLR
jgi:hypothetical protein